MMSIQNESLLGYRRLVNEFSKKLGAEEIRSLSYVYGLGDGSKVNSALELLLKLEHLAHFSFEEPEGLIQVAKDAGFLDWAKKFEDYAEHRTSVDKKLPSRRRSIISDDVRQNLEEVHDKFATKCIAVEEDFQLLWKRDKIAKDDGLKFLRKAKKLTRELESIVEKSEEKLLNSVSPSSPGLTSSSSSSSSLELSTSPEPTPRNLAEYSSKGERERKEGGRNRDKPCPKPRRPKTPPPYQPPAQEFAQAVQESTVHTSPMLKTSASHDIPPPVPPKKQNSPMLKRATHKPSATSKMCYTKPSVCVQVQRKKSDERLEVAFEEGDPGSDSGLESGSGSVQHGTITEWRDAMKHPPPEPNGSGHKYTPINVDTKDEDQVYALPREELDPKY